MSKAIVKVTADKLDKRDKKIKKIKNLIFYFLFILVLLYIVLTLVYKGANFTISLDPEFTKKRGIVLFNDLNSKNISKKLYVENNGNLDNISIDWLPSDIDKLEGGSHNGDNYVAYTFYLENQGKEIVDYWYEIHLEDVIKNVDEAVRIIIYQNGEKKVYAKKNKDTTKPEENTIPFYSESSVVLESRTNFKPNDIDKYTIVLFVEGNDPDCVDDLIGGEIKMSMDIYEEHINEKEK